MSLFLTCIRFVYLCSLVTQTPADGVRVARQSLLDESFPPVGRAEVWHVGSKQDLHFRQLLLNVITETHLPMAVLDYPAVREPVCTCLSNLSTLNPHSISTVWALWVCSLFSLYRPSSGPPLRCFCVLCASLHSDARAGQVRCPTVSRAYVVYVCGAKPSDAVQQGHTVPPPHLRERCGRCTRA